MHLFVFAIINIYMKKYYSFLFEKVTAWLQPEEIENSPGLQIISWCILVSVVVFLFWSNVVVGARIFNTSCWTFFQDCKNLQDIFFLNSYLGLRSLQITLFLGILCYAAYSLLKKRYLHYLISFLVFYFFLLLPWFLVAGYHERLFTYPEYYLFFIVSLFIFTPKHRFFFLQLFFLLSYVLSTISKIGSETWLLGLLELPLIPQVLMPFFTNSLIIVQLLVPVLLLSNNKKIRVGAFLLFEIFHLYSVSLAWVTFFLVTSPLLFVLFYNNYEEMNFRKIYKSLGGFIIITVLIFFNLVRVFIPGNDYLTFEGSYLGFNMFQSKKGCQIEYRDKNLVVQKIDYGINSGNQICDPYNVLKNVKLNCPSSSLSADGRYLKVIIHYPNKTYKLVDVKDYCQLEYKAFSHNEWIHPVLMSDTTSLLNGPSKFFSNYKNLLQIVYSLMFTLIFIFFFFKIVRR